MTRNLILLITVCLAVGCASCRGAMGTPFFSKFSARDLVERNKPAAGLKCEPLGGGSDGISSRAGGLNGSRSFHAHRSDSFACQLDPAAANFDEQRLFSALKTDTERSLRDSGAQITQSGSSGPANFYFAYAANNVSGRIQVSGTRTGDRYYQVHADLDENGN